MNTYFKEQLPENEMTVFFITHLPNPRSSPSTVTFKAVWMVADVDLSPQTDKTLPPKSFFRRDCLLQWANG